MARRGRFGRLPRSVPSLTSTLVAIAHEMQNTRDSNIMSAWQKGGDFEGQKATDGLVLKYWRERMKDVSKDDPNYNSYKNLVTQYEYAIESSKAETKYAQILEPSAGDDQAMASFYLNWAKKVPQDSEFYRVLMRDAAQFMRAAKAKQKAAKDKADEDKYVNQQKGIADDGKNGEYLTDVMTRLARAGSPTIYGTIAPLIGDQDDISKFWGDDPEMMIRLIKMISPEATDIFTDPRLGDDRMEKTGSPLKGSSAVLYHDDLGKPVTGADIVAAIAKNDPKFGGHLDVSYFRGQIDEQRKSLDKAAKLAEKTGHYADAARYNSALADVAETARQVAAYPVQQSYFDARARWDAATKNTGLPPKALDAEWEIYRKALIGLAGDPRIAEDDHLRSQLLGEANQVDGTVTLAEDLTGAQTGRNDGQGDVAINKANLQSKRDQIEAVADPENGMAWTQGETRNVNGVPTFVPVAGGKEIGAAPITLIEEAGKGTAKYISSSDGQGGFMQMMIIGRPVTLTGHDPRTGEAINFKDNPQVATVYTLNRGGKEVETFEFKGPDGKPLYTGDLVGQGIDIKRGANGYVLDVTRVVPADTTGPTGGPIGTSGWSIEGKKPETLTRNAAAGTYSTAAAKTGKVSVSALDALFTTDPERLAAGVDPTTDFVDINMAIYLSDPEGERQWNDLIKDPEFIKTLDTFAHLRAGQTVLADGVTWTGGDPAAYATYKAKIDNTTKGDVGTDDYKTRTGTDWDKSAPKPLVAGATANTRVTDGKLPSDNVGDTPFQSLGRIFEPGTARFGAPPSANPGSSIKLSGTYGIKLPGMPNSPWAPGLSSPTPWTSTPVQGSSVNPSGTPPPVTTTYIPSTPSTQPTQPKPRDLSKYR